MTNFPLTNRILKVAVLATALLAFANDALANQVTIDRFAGYWQNSGGEFTLTGADPAAINAIQDIAYPAYASVAEGVGGGISIQSFCIEMSENIGTPETVDYTVSGDGAVGGGVGGTPDPLSIGTAYLYSMFATGFAGYGGTAVYDYTVGNLREASAGLLQNAFWMLEQELAWDATNPFIFDVMSLFGGQVGAQANNAGTFDVFAVNTTIPGNGANRQSMLVYTSLERKEVPDGGLTLMMLGVGLSGLAVLRRKML